MLKSSASWPPSSGSISIQLHLWEYETVLFPCQHSTDKIISCTLKHHLNKITKRTCVPKTSISTVCNTYYLYSIICITAPYMLISFCSLMGEREESLYLCFLLIFFCMIGTSQDRRTNPLCLHNIPFEKANWAAAREDLQFIYPQPWPVHSNKARL